MDTIYSVERGKRAHQLTHVIIGLQARLALPARLYTNSPVRSICLDQLQLHRTSQTGSGRFEV